MKLKEFSGNYDEWESFSDLVISLIHTNQQLTMVQKLYYLRASVTGEAARMISAFDLTANNYLVAWNVLKDRFENKHMLIKRHMAGLLGIVPLKRESSSGLLDLADEFNRHVQLLDKLEEVEHHWNSFLVERLSSCLDPNSLREWETQSAGVANVTYKQILEFIQKRSRILQTLMLSQPCNNLLIESKPRSRVPLAYVGTSNTTTCMYCKQSHFLFQCEKFHNLTPHERFDLVKRHNLCINCLKGNHLARDCTSGVCKTCGKKHHSLLHLPPLPTSIAPANGGQLVQQSSFARSNLSEECQLSQFDSVESSRLVELPDASPLNTSVLASSSSVETTSPSSPVASFDFTSPPTACQSTKIVPDNQATVLLSTAVIKVRDSDNKFQFARALLDSDSQPSFISEVLCQRLNLCRTLRCWISPTSENSAWVHRLRQDEALDAQLERFWGMEDLDNYKAYTADEQFCEDHFCQTVSRDDDGRFRLAANENIRQEYLQFMQEYEKLGHMEVISRAVNGPQFFLPHHAVHRPESTTTKTRIVFDGSCRGTNNLPINEALVAGPTIQPVLYSTVINFRKPRFVVTADVE
ncbi:uncharacterized protein LOC129717044 [Wyeomyia smithii]|uniref:uncharacterized protein LOC129717044 n=1 Tax=Wyeomyia smithii TaxID=174621 RepID=UPI002468161B|nr:uncharacterized protein LOC129717044 [Wyeomyia smithii]